MIERAVKLHNLDTREPLPTVRSRVCGTDARPGVRIPPSMRGGRAGFGPYAAQQEHDGDAQDADGRKIAQVRHVG